MTRVHQRHTILPRLSHGPSTSAYPNSITQAMRVYQPNQLKRERDTPKVARSNLLRPQLMKAKTMVTTPKTTSPKATLAGSNLPARQNSFMPGHPVKSPVASKLRLKMLKANSQPLILSEASTADHSARPSLKGQSFAA